MISCAYKDLWIILWIIPILQERITRRQRGPKSYKRLSLCSIVYFADTRSVFIITGHSWKSWYLVVVSLPTCIHYRRKAYIRRKSLGPPPTKSIFAYIYATLVFQAFWLDAQIIQPIRKLNNKCSLNLRFNFFSSIWSWCHPLHFWAKLSTFSCT